jgi:5,10-methylenetetrahydrofolate reductase
MTRVFLSALSDPPKGEEDWQATEGGFQCALDLVNYIRAEYGDYFGVVRGLTPRCQNPWIMLIS